MTAIIAAYISGILPTSVFMWIMSSIANDDTDKEMQEIFSQEREKVALVFTAACIFWFITWIFIAIQWRKIKRSFLE